MANPMQEKSVFVEFFNEAVEFKAESEKAGRPVFREIPFVRIHIPGDKNNVVVTKATDYHREKYPMAWARFQSGQSEAVEGMPLKDWAQVRSSQVKEAEYFGIRTVEQLAAVTDTNIQKMGMGFLELRRKAQTFLSAMSGADPVAQAEENQRLREDLATLKAQFEEMSRNIPRGPGRPKKETAEA